MPTSPERAEQQRAQQAALVVAFWQPFLALWASLNVRDMAGSSDRVLDALRALTRRHAAAQVQSSALWYRTVRVEAGLRDRYRVPNVDLPSDAEVERTFRALTKDLWVPKDLPPDLDEYVQVITDEAAESVAAELSDKIADAGRRQTEAAIKADPAVQHFARIAKPGACWFCMMLATRGAVYASEANAGSIDASENLDPDARGAINRFHTNCRCTVVGVTGKWDLPEHVQKALDLYNDVAENERGKNKAKAFRRAYEGREAPAAKTKTRKPKVSPFDDPEWVAHQLALTESLPDSPWRAAQLARLRKAARRHP